MQNETTRTLLRRAAVALNEPGSAVDSYMRAMVALNEHLADESIEQIERIIGVASADSPNIAGYRRHIAELQRERQRSLYYNLHPATLAEALKAAVMEMSNLIAANDDLREQLGEVDE